MSDYKDSTPLTPGQLDIARRIEEQCEATTLYPQRYVDGLNAEIARLRGEAQAWFTAALACGLYRSDTDVSTPAKWQSAQVKAAADLITKNERHLCALETIREACSHYADGSPDAAPRDWFANMILGIIERDGKFKHGAAK